MLDVETRDAEGAKRRLSVETGERLDGRAGDDEESASDGVEDEGQRLGEVAVRDLRTGSERTWGRSGARSTSFKKGGSTTAMSTLPRSSAGSLSGSSRS